MEKDLFYTMGLESERVFAYTIDKHESTPFLRMNLNAQI